MKLLIIGGGGREHALAWKAAASEGVNEVLVAPGNAGTAALPKTRNVPGGGVAELVALAQREGVDLAIVGPEAPLVAGVVDAFSAVGLRCFGPTKAAAQLEGSKQFTKDFCDRHGIPTARWQCFDELDSALAYIESQTPPIVVKADGLAAGKGVTVATTVTEASAAARAILAEKRFGEAGSSLVVEDFLPGEEVSYMVLASGTRFQPLASSKDHKRRFDGDAGPNTGGMGAFSPAPRVTPEVEARIIDRIIAPTLAGMQAEGNSYQGFLYAGLMLDDAGNPSLVEYNCRLGDPETQPILLRLESDLVEMLLATLNGEPDAIRASWSSDVAVGVVLVASGYPGAYPKGDIISGLHGDHARCRVFHAGTRETGGDVVTNGGRVLAVTALGGNMEFARECAYEKVREISWPGMGYRTDIGKRLTPDS